MGNDRLEAHPIGWQSHRDREAARHAFSSHNQRTNVTRLAHALRNSLACGPAQGYARESSLVF